MPAAAPEQSTATSSSRSSGSGAVLVSKPSSAARASRAASRSAPRTCTRPPHARATCAASRPTGPGPTTSTSSPAPIRGGSRRQLQTQASGSANAAAALGSHSGTRWRPRAGTSSRAAKAPSTAEPIERRSGQRFTRPERQCAHVPHVEKYVSETTRAPSQAGSTPSPTSATTPHTSWPIVTGGRDRNSSSTMCRSVPQMPAASTASTT